MPSIMGAPYVGEGMDNINQPGAVQGDWNGTLQFWNTPQLVSEFKKCYPVNPFQKGSVASKLYDGGGL